MFFFLNKQLINNLYNFKYNGKDLKKNNRLEYISKKIFFLKITLEKKIEIQIFILIRAKSL
jgi:hypothetical protein